MSLPSRPDFLVDNYSVPHTLHGTIIEVDNKNDKRYSKIQLNLTIDLFVNNKLLRIFLLTELLEYTYKSYM
jgi:hypothetical protein